MSGRLNSGPYKWSNNNTPSSVEKKGIVSILCSDSNYNSYSNMNTNTNTNSDINIDINNNNKKNIIRRSMSADMSSKNWHEKSVFPMKAEKCDKVGPGGAAFDDIWSSILTNERSVGSGSGSGSEPNLPPYVHPLTVKRANSLSKQSLEICTESLGSETGSDGFSSPVSDHGGEKYDEVVDEKFVVGEGVVRNNDYVEVGKCSYNFNYGVKNRKVNGNGNVNGNYGKVGSFPPPLVSLANRDDGSNLEMRTHRQDGRLVLEAVSVPSRNCFRACREGGRLVLTFTNDDINEDNEEDEDEDDVVEDDVIGSGDEVVGGVDNTLALVMKETNSASWLPKTQVINVHAAFPRMIMTSSPRTTNMTVITPLNEEHVPGGMKTTKPPQKGIASLLPPRPRMSTTTNGYEYYWHRSDANPTSMGMLESLAGKQNQNAEGMVVVSPQVVKDTKRILLGHNIKGAGAPKGEEVILVGEEYLVPILRGCKEPRRSLLFWDPFCIATS